MEYKIKFLKTSDEFEVIVPDPLNENETLKLRIDDSELYYLLVTGKQRDLDDDTFLGITNLRKTHTLTVHVMNLAKRQLHLRELNRVDTSWYVLKPKIRKPKCTTPERVERLKYLTENYNAIVENCLSHDWFDEFYKLNKDIDPHKKKTDIVQDWRELKIKRYGEDTY